MILFLICFCLGYSSAARTSPQVRTSFGFLRGSVLESRNGREYFAFNKVPFAKPPVGELRFKDPLSPDSWNDTLDASRPNLPCFQILGNIPMGTEDCLYLNVYTPKLNGTLPVMIYFFGGGWRVGVPGPSSASHYFMDEEVVLVMINYRLGALGFLSTEDEKIPGNMGLKDMAAALEWTKNEISNFGGNPDLITAFGLSAGAASAHYLCSIPKTKVLLKGCISQSGVGGNHWSLRKPGAAKKTALIVAEAVGCTGENILSCLQSKTAEEITRTEPKLRFWVEEPLIIHGPVLEHNHQGALLTKWPLPDTNFPWLTGVTTLEGRFRTLGLKKIKDTPLMSDFIENKQNYLKRMLNLPEGNIQTIDRIVKKFFPNNDILEGIEELYTEGYFLYPALYELKNHQGPKYFYVFNVTGGPSLWEPILRERIETTSGVAHGDDYPFFFDISFFHGRSSSIMSQPDKVKLSHKLIKLWVNFAKYQKPTIEGEETNWPQFGNNSQYLFLSNEKFLNKEYDGINNVLEFWNGILKKPEEETVVSVPDEL